MKKRCFWVNLKNPLYVDYHDFEWGRPVHDDQHLFEMLILEGVQAGLSWETVLNKRAHYREMFNHFDPEKVAAFSEAKLRRFLKDPGLIRNKLKMEAAVHNAKMFLKVQKEFKTFDKYLWSFVDNKPLMVEGITSIKDCPTETPVSRALAKDLKKRGFKFVGSTIMYAFMQAVGMTNDHSEDCFLYGKKLRSLKRVR